ncbi:calcium-dependent lipid-binding (CaLB domain) family protein [Actinidia rufa]|uniref:Calcium-dependent lipid-binding (CaLB domain) family protein n=1 Tax=Actinidia rufa TaxID=165716 RepID=A0A7J0FKN5_9ERIC|nr:calcium-dependent lipid-binding (CaLB domain) family protein [Actinidia rufa]
MFLLTLLVLSSEVHNRYVMRLRRKLQFEESRNSNQRRVLSDSETVRWLNHVVEKIWPVCMEQIVSQKILLPIIPWFLDKYKPWTVKKAVVQHLYMGRSPPLFTEMRVLRQSTGDDHLVLIGVKFIRHWPFLGRLRVCFVDPPYFQMTVKPVFNHGLDVTELPGIAGWLDKLLALAFEQTLVEPNMLVVDVEKFVSPQQENWFSIDEKESIGYALVEVIEAADMKPSDLNGLADPYVKGQLGSYRFRSKTHRKTLTPKWHEEFKVPICTWESPNVLAIEVCDKDHFVDDTLGDCSIIINNLRGGQRHDMWLPLQNIKMGRLHLAITIVEVNRKEPDQPCDGETLNDGNKRISISNETNRRGSLSSEWSEKSQKVADKLEPIDVEGQQETGIWVHQPGSEVSQIWEPRKGRNRLLDPQVHRGFNNDGNSSTDESQEGNKGNQPNKVKRGLKKIGSLFRRNSQKEDKSSRIEVSLPSTLPNLKAVHASDIGVQLIIEDNHLSAPSPVNDPKSEGTEGPEGSGQESPSKSHVKANQ